MRAVSVAFSLEKGSGDLAGRVHPLLDVHRQGQEVDVAKRPRRRRGEHHRVALPYHHRTRGLLRHPPGLKRDLAARDLHGDPRYLVTAHSLFMPSFSASSIAIGGVARWRLAFSYLCLNARSLADDPSAT